MAQNYYSQAIEKRHKINKLVVKNIKTTTSVRDVKYSISFVLQIKEGIIEQRIFYKYLRCVSLDDIKYLEYCTELLEEISIIIVYFIKVIKVYQTMVIYYNYVTVVKH